jgi:hypothetical protein
MMAASDGQIAFTGRQLSVGARRLRALGLVGTAAQRLGQGQMPRLQESSPRPPTEFGQGRDAGAAGRSASPSNENGLRDIERDWGGNVRSRLAAPPTDGPNGFSPAVANATLGGIQRSLNHVQGLRR